MKDKNIIRHSRKVLPKGKTQWEKLSSMSEKEIANGAQADFDNPRWTKNMLDEAILVNVSKQ